MADEDIELPDRGYNTEDVRAQRPVDPPKRRRRWGLWVLFILVVVPAALMMLWTFITLSYTYASGERSGYVQKLSRKGWLCKTWEGELAMASMPGAMPEIFRFTVRDDAVAARINQSMGSRVAIDYKQHRGVPLSCFGETEYFVDNVRVVDALTYPPGTPVMPNPGSSGTAVPAPAPAPPATVPRP